MKNRFRPRRRRAAIQAIQKLEPRQLLSFSAPVPNSAVIMNTSLGEIAIQLDTDGTVPITVSNFLSYVGAGTYNGTIFHRVTFNGDSNQDTFGVVQGGGFTDNNGALTAVSTNAPIANEFTDAHPDAVGTIAMARTSGLNSATSQFFFNTTDNTSIFGDSNPFAAFGNVIRGLGIIDTVDFLSTTNSASANDGETLNPPETNTGAFVTINTATVEDSLTVTIGKNDAAGDHAVSFRDPSTQTGSTISLSGADATVTFTGTNLVAHRSNGTVMVTGTNLQCQEVASTDSTAKSTLNFSSPGRNKHVNIGDINITGSINAINGSGVNLTGDIAVTGGINEIKLLASNAAGFISIDTDQVANAPATTINVPFLSDISIQSGGSIKELITRQYTVDDGTSRQVSAAGDISKVMNFGLMSASISATGTTSSTGAITGGNIGSVTAVQMSGNIQGQTVGSVTVDQFQNGFIFSSAPFNAKTLGISKVNILGAVNAAEIVAVGNIGTIKAGSLTSSSVAAGFDSDSGSNGDGLSPLGGFENVLDSNASIKSISVKTPKGAKNAGFSDSQIAAGVLDSLHLGRVATTVASGSSIPLIGIQTNDLKSLVATTDQKQSLDLSNITSQATLNTLIANRKIKLNSFTFSIGGVVQTPPASG